MLILFMT